MTKRVAIIGAGGHARVVFDALEAVIKAGEDIEIAGFIAPKDPNNLPACWLGGDEVLSACCARSRVTHFIVGVGSVFGGDTLRERLYAQAVIAGAAPYSIAHPSAVISPYSNLANGVTIMAGATICTGVEIYNNAIINTRASVDHDCIIGKHAHIAPGAVLSGDVTVGARALIGIGSTCKQGVRIGKGATVGAGAVVISDVPDNAVYIGVPATAAMRSC